MPPTEPAGVPTGDPTALAAAVRTALREELTATGFAPRPQPLLTYDGVAEWLDVSRRTVEALVADGEIPVVRIGTGKRKLPRFDPEAVQAFIRRSASGAASARRA